MAPGPAEFPGFAAIVLAGGQGERLGGADKPGLRIGGRSMLATVVGVAVSAGAQAVVVVGPRRPGLGPLVRFTSEQPPGAGPVPALRAGLRLVTASWLLLLAADLPFLRAEHLRALVEAASRADGRESAGSAVLADPSGSAQWLVSAWRTADLRAALAGYRGDSLHGVLAPLRPAEVTIATGGGPPPWLDCDTPGDLAMALEWVRREETDEHAV